MQILLTQLEKIMKFLAPKNPLGICAFIAIIGIIYWWISNYSKLAYLLLCLIGKK